MDDVDVFEHHRGALLALAYRMLGDMARAEDMVQDAWVRWQGRAAEVRVPKAFLLSTVTRLCLDELGSAHARRELSRGDRLPEPVDRGDSAFGRVDMLDQISMAFLVMLQRLTPAERAVFVLHEVFDLSHAEIAPLVERSEAACRQLLSRARDHVAVERRALHTSRDEHERLLMAFVRAITSGEHAALAEVLAEDAVLIADAGPGGGRFGRIRNVGRPVVGRKKVAALVKAIASQDGLSGIELRQRVLNGEPAVVAFSDGHAVVAIFVSVGDGQIRGVFLQADSERLRYVGAPS